MTTGLKIMAFFFALWLMVHWLTAGQDEIIEGPPEILETPSSTNE